MSIGIVGDLHIAPKPSSRIDDYFNAGLQKIFEISEKCKHVIFLGDIFSHPKIEEQYLSALITTFNNIKSVYGTQFYTIIGNHDIANENEINLKNSSLGILNCCGIINVILPQQPLVLRQNNYIYRFNTTPVNFEKAKQYLSDKHYDNLLDSTNKYESCIDILLLHHLYETGSSCFSYNDLRNLGCELIFLGHDHKPFDQGKIQYPEFTIYKSGSIMRNKADDYNFSRQLYYNILQDGKVINQSINTTSAENIFKIEALTRQNLHKQKFLESVHKVIDKYKNNISNQSRFSIKNILQELNAPISVIEGINQKYNKFNEVFE